MGFGWILAGLLFIFNPCINVVDIIPDFIGFLLVAYGLSRMTAINADIEESRKWFLILAAVDLAKFLSIALMSSQDPTRYLLFAFVFGVADLGLFFLAASRMFSGLETVGIKYSSSSILASVKKKNGKVKDRITTARNSLIVFYIVRVVFSVLPELSELQLFDYVGSVSNRAVRYSDFKTIFYLMSFIVVIAFAVPAIVKTAGFFRSVIRDKQFIEKAKTETEEYVKKNSDVYISRKMRTGLIFFALSSFAVISPVTGGFRVVPLFLWAVLFGASALMLNGVKKIFTGLVPPVLTVLVLSVASFILRNIYIDDFTSVRDAVRYPQAGALFWISAGLTVIQLIMVLVSEISFAVNLRKVTRAHYGISVRTFSDIYGLSEKNAGESAVEFMETADRYYTFVKTGITVIMALNIITLILSFLPDTLTAMMLISSGVTDVLSRVFTWVNLITVILTGIWCVVTAVFCSLLRKNIYKI